MFSRALLFVALVAVAAASGYIPGREYVYKHSGYIFSGFPDKKPQYAGNAFETLVTIQPKGEYAVFKVDQPKYSLINDEIEDFETYPYDHKDLPAAAGFLTQPFRVYYKNGQVTQFQVAADEPAFSRNIKRGLISLFNLNFDVDSSVPSDKDNEIYRPDYSAHYYKFYEDGVLGECETEYVIEHEPYYLTPHNNIVLNVTKARNYHKCTSAPHHFYANFYGHECGHGEHERAHTLHGNAHFQYDIRGDRHHYVIEKITTVGETAYTPYPLEGQSATIYVNRTVLLIDEKEVSQPIDLSGDVKSFYTLKYEIPFKPEFKGQVDLKKPHYLYHIYGRKAKPEGIRNLFAQLVAVYDDESYLQKAKDKNYPAIFLELVRAFSTLSYGDLDALYKEFAEFETAQATPVKVRQRSLFYDAIVNTGTNPALLLQKNLIKSKKVTMQVALYFIQQAQHHVKEVTEVLLDEIQDLCEDGFVRSDPNLYASCYATLSNIVYDRCVARYQPEAGMGTDQYTCPDDIPVKYFNHIARLYEQTDEEFLQVLYMKAAGNLGVRESLKYLRPYVEGHGKSSLYLRSTAIWALKNTGFRYPELVRELLIPLYVNRSENYELRLAAFTLLLMYRPGLFELETAAKALWSEEDDQVRSYVYSTLKSMANSTYPCDHVMAENARYALAALRRYNHDFEQYDYSFSTHHYSSGYDKDYDFGGFTRFAYFASDTGYIPRTVYLGVGDYLGGKSLDTFGIGFKQYGLEKFFDRLFGPQGAYGKRSLFDLFKKRAKRNIGNVEKERREIQEKLQLKTQSYPPIRGEIFFKYMGNHISFLYFNESTFANFFREGAFPIPNYPAAYQQLPQFHYQRFLLAVDRFYVIPSEAGLPIVFDYKQPVYFYHKNNKLGFKVNPAFFRDERQNQMPTDVQVNIDGHIIADKNLYASLGLVVPFEHLTFGAGINRRSTVSLPTKVDIKLDLQTSKLTTKWKPVVPHEIYHFHYEPYTFLDLYKNHLPVDAEKPYLPVRRMGLRKQVEKNFFHDALGLGINMKKDFDNEWNDMGSWISFMTKKDFREKFYYLYANPQFEPYHYDITLQPDSKDVTTEVETSLQYSSYSGEEPRAPSPLAEAGFQEYGQNKFGKQFLTSILQGEIVARGQKERKIQAEMVYSRDFMRFYHKLNMYYQRTPFTSSESKNFKVCGTAYMKYPDYNLEKVYTMDSVGMDRTTEGKAKIHFGQDCTSDQKIAIHAQFGATEEQIELERAREEPDTPEHHNPYAYYYQKCQKDRQDGQLYPKSCIDYIYLFYNVHKYVYHVKHEKLSPEFLNMTYKIGGFLRHAMYDYADHNVIGVQNPDDELHIEFNVSAISPIADLRVKKPRSESHYTHMYVPGYEPFVSFPYYMDVHIKKSLNKHYCLLDRDAVTTFDQFTYKLPPIDCYTVLAKDCSPNENYVVLTSKINHPKYKRQLKVLLGKHKVEILPVSDDSDLIVRVDGKKVAVNEPYYFYETPDDKEPEFYISQIVSYFSLHSVKYGVGVEFDGHFVYLVNSIYYRAKLCGLCGNYNGQRYDGYETEDGCYLTSTDAYAYSFAIPSDTCTVPKSDYPCYGEAGAGCTELKTHVVQLTTGKVPQTCFSTKPVPQCRPGCVAANQLTKTIGYHCLPTKDDSTKNLLRQQETRVLYEVRRKSEDHTADVQFAERCYRQ